MKILITTHGEFGPGLKSSVDMIMQSESDIDIISLTEEGIEQYKEKLNEYLNAIDDVLILTDLFGGTPFNSSYEYKCLNKEKQISIISGVNLPIIIQAQMLQTMGDLTVENIDQLINQGTEGIKWIK